MSRGRGDPVGRRVGHGSSRGSQRRTVDLLRVGRLLMGAALTAVLVSLGTADVAAQTAAADSAWRAGDLERAERLYGEALAADST